MNVKEAEKIIGDYKEALFLGTEGETILRRVSFLPYSKAKIKFAYFTQVEDTFKREGKIEAGLKENLLESYSFLNTFVNDEIAIKYAANYQDWQSKKGKVNKNKKDEKLITQYLYLTHSLGSGDLTAEINDFIEELKEQKKAT